MRICNKTIPIGILLLVQRDPDSLFFASFYYERISGNKFLKSVSILLISRYEAFQRIAKRFIAADIRITRNNRFARGTPVMFANDKMHFDIK